MPLNHSDVSMFRNEREAMRFWSSPGVVWLIPLLTGLTAGFLAGFVVAVVSWRLGDPLPLNTFLITMSTVAGIVWLWLTLIAFSKIGFVPGQSAKTTRIETVHNDGRQIKILELETATPEQTLKVCKLGGSLTYRSLRPYFSDEGIAAFQRELSEKKLAYWKNPDEHRGGMHLTEEGKGLFENYLRENTTSPTPEVDNV